MSAVWPAVEVLLFAAVLTAGGLVIGLLLLDGRIARRTWSEHGSEPERFAEIVQSIEEYWTHHRELEPAVAGALAADLQELCVEAQHRSASVQQVFGPDLKSFADEWASAHYKTPPLRLRMMWRFINIASAAIAGFSALGIVGLRSDLAWEYLIFISIWFGAVGAFGLLVGTPIRRSLKPVSPYRRLLSLAAFIAGSLASLIGLAFAVGRVLRVLGVEQNAAMPASPSDLQLMAVVVVFGLVLLWSSHSERQLLATAQDPWARA